MALNLSVIEVAIPGPFLHAFTYLLPEGVSAETLFRGQRVLVPFRNQERVGFVHKMSPASVKPGIRLKRVSTLIDTVSPISERLIALGAWAMDYYMAPPGEVYRALFPLYALKKNLPLNEGNKGEEATQAPIKIGPLKRLTPVQRDIYTALLAMLEAEQFSPALLYGVTGSGKTEIYMHLMADVLKDGGQVLFLLPEIGLTPQLTHRIEHVFGEHVAVSHSHMTDKQRYVAWRDVREGRKSVVVGTRSALFLPFPRLRLLIVDEEHDHSYKQEEGFRYHARDLALVRAKLEQAAVVLGSATPSLESLWNAEHGKYRAFVLKERPYEAVLPRLRVVDLKRYRDKKGRIPLISEPLRVAIATHLASKHQVLLFLNRRGYATLVVCNACGESLKCVNCSVGLTYHQALGQCLCHYCNRRVPIPLTCPSCAAPALVKLGAGTQRLETVVSTLFPHARLLRVDRDTLQSKKRTAEFFEKMQKREADIILGTQLLAKGHDYPHITLVGVVDADLNLNFPDFRAEERVYQELLQVSGRAGRAHAEGEVFIQTMNPDHPIFKFLVSNEPEAFWKEELEERRRFGYPPWKAFVQVECSGARAVEVSATCKRLFEALQAALPANGSLSLLGPAPAPIEKVRGRYRWLFIVRSDRRKALKDYLRSHAAFFEKAPPTVKVSIDVDPYSMM